jgi:Zn-dependent protease
MRSTRAPAKATLAKMDIADGLIQYLMLVALLTFHEFGHAWTAWRCGDDTARLQGRVSLNPLVHIDPVGTVILPLLMIFLPSGASRFMIGWAKPVPVNPDNLRNKNVDDVLVTMAGPGMNLLLAVLLMAGARAGLVMHSLGIAEYCVQATQLSLLLCFFNLIPIPPLDGSHLLRVATGMTWETYHNFSRFGFIIVIFVLQIPIVRELLASAMYGTMGVLGNIFGVQ